MREAIDEYKLGIESGDKYNENGTFGPKAKAFTGNNALGKLGNRIDSLVGLLLEIPDRAAIKAQYNSVLNQLIKSNPEAVQANEGLPTPEMVDTALWSALNITFRDDNRVTEAMQTVRNGLNIAGDIIAPFVKTPTNVVMRGLEFTPVAWGEALYKGLIGPNSMRALKKEGESTLRIQREIAQLIGRGAVGTALILAGTALRQAGLGTGGDEEEVAKEQGWRQVTGEQANSIKIGDHYYDISSIPPLSIPLLAGMALKGGISWGNFFGAIGGLANSATEMPVLQGVKELLGGGYGQKGAGEVAATLVGNLATQVIPFISLSRQVANLTDPYVRTTSADGTGIEKIAGQTVNKIKNSIPGLRQTLPVKTDQLGNAIENYPAETALGRAGNIFFNPLNMSLENTDPVVKEIDDMYKKTGSTSVLPPTAPTGTFNIDNESYKLTARERQEWQQTAGQFTAEALQDLFDTPEWKNGSLEDQQKMLAKVYTMANIEAKGDYAEDHNLNYTPDEKSGTQYDTLRSQGLSAGVALGILTHKDGTAETAGYIYDHISDQSQREAALAAVGVTAKAWQKGYKVYSPYMSTADFNTAYIIARKSGIKKEEAIAELRNAGVGLASYNQASRFYRAVHD